MLNLLSLTILKENTMPSNNMSYNLSAMYHLPKEPYAPFELMAQGVCDFTVEAFPIKVGNNDIALCIATPEGAVYVTKEQAMKFFNLKEDFSTLEIPSAIQL